MTGPTQGPDSLGPPVIVNLAGSQAQMVLPETIVRAWVKRIEYANALYMTTLVVSIIFVILSFATIPIFDTGTDSRGDSNSGIAFLVFTPLSIALLLTMIKFSSDFHGTWENWMRIKSRRIVITILLFVFSVFTIVLFIGLAIYLITYKICSLKFDPPVPGPIIVNPPVPTSQNPPLS